MKEHLTEGRNMPESSVVRYVLHVLPRHGTRLPLRLQVIVQLGEPVNFRRFKQPSRVDNAEEGRGAVVD